MPCVAKTAPNFCLRRDESEEMIKICRAPRLHAHFERGRKGVGHVNNYNPSHSDSPSLHAFPRTLSHIHYLHCFFFILHSQICRPTDVSG